MPGSPPQVRPDTRQNAAKSLYRQDFLGLSGGSHARFASPPQVAGHFGETNPRCKSATIDRAHHGPLQQGFDATRAGATKNPARCPARVCRIVLNCALTIRDSGNASQDKTPPGFLDGVSAARSGSTASIARLAWRGVNATGRHHLFPNLIRELIGRGCPRSVGPHTSRGGGGAASRTAGFSPAVSLQGSGECVRNG